MDLLPKNMQNTLKHAQQTGALGLTNLNLTSIPKEIFTLTDQNLEQKWWEMVPLQKLDISNNNIKEIPQQIQQLIELNSIRAVNNKIDCIAPELFLLQQLKLLDLQHNLLQFLPANIGACSSLVEINLEDNKLKELPDSLNQLTQLEKLILSKNDLTILPNFSNLTKLKFIDLKSNKLKYISNNSFKGLTLLENLTLAENLITDIQQGSFTSLTNLVYFELRQNRLTQFNEFPNSERLDTLILSYNSISIINNFDLAPSLTVLDLKNNKIQQIDLSLCKLQKLKTLDLSNNDLLDLPNEIGFLSKLVRISIEGNPLKTIKQSIKIAGADSLKSYLINRISGDIEQAKLKINPNEKTMKMDQWEILLREFYQNGELVIRNQKLQMLDQKVYNLKDLKILDLSQNEFKQFPEQITEFQMLKIIKMNCNLLEELPQSILNLSNLQQLEFSGNKLKTFFPFQTTSSLQQLVSLDLSKNKLTEFPKVIESFLALRHLNLAYNLISDLSILLNSSLTNLEVLDMSNNSIMEISDQIAIFSLKLSYINLENNALTKLPTIIGFMESIKGLVVEGNPLKTIQRNVIQGGAVALVEYLRNRHQGELPNIKQMHFDFQNSMQQQMKRTQFQKKQQNQMNIEEPMKQRQNIPQQQQQEEYQYQTLRSKEEIMQEEHKKQQSQQQIIVLQNKIRELENQLAENFTLNNFQKNNLKREIQQLLIQRNQLEAYLSQNL